MIEKLRRSVGLVLIWGALGAGNALAQQVEELPRGRGQVQYLPQSGDMQNARVTARDFGQLLRQYPPYVTEVLRLDPSLLTNTQFLAPYPGLAAFLTAHPEIVRSPSFFLGTLPPQQVIDVGYRPRNNTREAFEEAISGVFFFLIFATIATFLMSVVKMIVDHRRWIRVSKVQSEVHSKLLDRFTASQDLLAYIQSPAGRHFLESAPIVTDPGTRPISAPVNRILWSVQVGIVLALAGIGLNWVSAGVIEDIAQPLVVFGVLVLALGIGFVLSALIAYVMSRRLGLIDQHTAGTPSFTNPGATPPNA